MEYRSAYDWIYATGLGAGNAAQGYTRIGPDERRALCSGVQSGSLKRAVRDLMALTAPPTQSRHQFRKRQRVRRMIRKGRATATPTVR